MREERIPDSREEIEKLILQLPPGYLSVKTINGKERYYHQWYADGKQHTKYVRADDYPELRDRIEYRRRLQARLKVLTDAGTSFSTSVVTGEGLAALADLSEGTGRRECFDRLSAYLGRSDPAVCIISGLRRTGKSMLTYQALADMDEDRLSRTAYITVGTGNTMYGLQKDLWNLRGKGFDTFFIDEVTRLDGFVESSFFFPDVLAATGARVVLTGTDSLGFWFASKGDLYGKATVIRTTHIPFREHSRLMGVDDIDDYIRHGGVFRGGEMDLDTGSFMESTAFDDEDETETYIGLAISRNIENTLMRHYSGPQIEDGLFPSHRDGTFPNIINRIVQDINHRFALSTIEKRFRSYDLDDLSHNIGQMEDGGELLSIMDRDAILERLGEILRVKEAEEIPTMPTAGQLSSFRRYLEAMDVFKPMPIVYEDPGIDTSSHTLCVQPGLRYFHAEALVAALEADPAFLSLPDGKRRLVSRMARDTVAGQIMEEIVLHDTMTSLGRGFEVSKLVTDAGEADMVIRDISDGRCVLVEIKHSGSRHANQTRHLRNAHVLDYAGRRFGEVSGRFVLYRGDDAEGEIPYVNVERYLRGLPGSALGLFPDRPR